MHKLVLAVFAACVAAAGTYANAADDMMKKDGMMKKGEMKKDGMMKKDEMKK